MILLVFTSIALHKMDIWNLPDFVPVRNQLLTFQCGRQRFSSVNPTLISTTHMCPLPTPPSSRNASIIFGYINFQRSHYYDWVHATHNWVTRGHRDFPPLLHAFYIPEELVIMSPHPHLFSSTSWYLSLVQPLILFRPCRTFKHNSISVVIFITSFLEPFEQL